MSATKAKPTTNNSSRIAALERRVTEQDRLLAQMADTIRRVVDSQVGALAAVEQLLSKAGEGKADA